VNTKPVVTVWSPAEGDPSYANLQTLVQNIREIEDKSIELGLEEVHIAPYRPLIVSGDHLNPLRAGEKPENTVSLYSRDEGPPDEYGRRCGKIIEMNELEIFLKRYEILAIDSGREFGFKSIAGSMASRNLRPTPPQGWLTRVV
jgi:hypothetical protein